MRRVLATAAACALAAAALPAAALADGDPASDVLLGQDSYLPYQPKVPRVISDALTATLKKSRAAGYKLKVAVIASKDDLGSVPDYFARPQDYAQFLQREISFNKPEPLLIVMPNGYGVADAGDKAEDAIAGLDKPASASGDALGRAAVTASVALAKANGHDIPAPKLPKAAGADDGGGTSPIIVFGIPVILLAIGGGLAALRARQREGDSAPAP
jgi:hypothetical protein